MTVAALLIALAALALAGYCLSKVSAIKAPAPPPLDLTPVYSRLLALEAVGAAPEPVVVTFQT